MITKIKLNKMEEKQAIRILDDAYISIMSLARSDDDYETMNLIQPILDKIDEIQNDLENLK
ncbi:MAG: hypothetical protein CMD25_08350 [Flavobacteriales bacterium]|nr:hypothetical protein [Flavobacteriales bacterium]